MIEVKIINKIEEKVIEYQKRTGATKTWIAKQMGYKTRQSLDGAMKSEKLALETYGRFAVFFKCNVLELYDMKFYEDGKQITF